jgi:sec-independent protein translocase protein TatA
MPAPERRCAQFPAVRSAGLPERSDPDVERQEPTHVGPMEIGLIILAVLLLFGYKKLPDASRSLGRSLRIFKGEVKGMRDDDAPRGNGPATHAELVPPAADLSQARGASSARP